MALCRWYSSVLQIHDSSDCDKLQEDLNSLERWESDWQMSFHPEKCEVVHITTKKTPILHSDSLHGHTLFSVPQIKYLGVHISQDLKWNSHINSTSSKANQTLVFLKQNLRINSSTVKEKAYKSFVHPKLEYCTVWDWFRGGQQGGWQEGTITLQAYQTCCAVWTGDRLEQRRVDSRLSMLFKIRHHLVAIDDESCLKSGTGSWEHQYRQLRADKDYTRFSFFPRTVIQWNQLPSHICLAESLDTFKTQVTKIEHSRLN